MSIRRFCRVRLCFLPMLTFSFSKNKGGAENENKCEHARSSALFNLSVEISILLNIIAATNDIEHEDLGKLRHACIEERGESTGVFL